MPSQSPSPERVLEQVSSLGSVSPEEAGTSKQMHTKRIVFGSPKEVTNPGDDSRGFLFPFACVETNLVGTPEEVGHTSKHRLIVTIANNRLPAWGYSEPDLVRVLFEIGRREVCQRAKSGTLKPDTRVQVDTESHSKTPPFDPLRIVVPDGAAFEVEEERRIGF